METERSPFFDLFLWLREQVQLPLTIDQYFLFLEALEKGYGTTNLEELKKLCRLLWVKPKDDQIQRFETYFEQYFSLVDEEDFTRVNEADDKVDKESSDTNEGYLPKTTPDISPPIPQPLLKTQKYPIALREEFLAKDSDLNQYSSALIIKDLPVSNRQLENSWRYLRRPIREGEKIEIDLEATLQKISEEGIFLEPVLIPNRVNQAELLLFIDSSSSMVPFQPLSEQLITTLRNGQLAKVDIYYFRNYPKDYLYLTPNGPDYIEVQQLLSQLHHTRTIALFFSDAGAARGNYNPVRLRLTHEFLDVIESEVRKVVWLNPLPESRWRGTTANSLAQIVKMLEFSPLGMRSAIRLFRS